MHRGTANQERGINGADVILLKAAATQLAGVYGRPARDVEEVLEAEIRRQRVAGASFESALEKAKDEAAGKLATRQARAGLPHQGESPPHPEAAPGADFFEKQSKGTSVPTGVHETADMTLLAVPRMMRSQGRGTDAIRRRTDELVARLLLEQRVTLHAAATTLAAQVGRPHSEVVAMLRDRQAEAMADGLGHEGSLGRAVAAVRSDVQSGRR